MDALQLALDYTAGRQTRELLADPDVRNILGASLTGVLRNLFDCMEIAEEEIAAAKAIAPDGVTEKRIDDAFRYLSPSDLLQNKTLELYRAHAHEIIARVAAGEDLRPGTEAEVLAALCESSLAAPLNSIAALLYARLFRSVFPELKELHFEAAYAGTSYYEMQADELLARTRRKLACERDVHVLAGD